MGRPRIKIYGERNTGTRYLRRLLTVNLDAQLLRGDVPRRIRRLAPGSESLRDVYFRLTFKRNLGWKHQVALAPSNLRNMQGFTDSVFFVTITKNPYAWLLSLYRRPYHYKGSAASFEEFLVNPWLAVGRENAGGGFANPIVMWNKKNTSYRNLCQGVPTVNLRYEDLLEDPERVVSGFALRFCIEPKSPHFVNYERSTKERDGKDFSYYRQYYLGEEWRGMLQPSQVSIINRYLDPELLAKFEYELLGAT